VYANSKHVYYAGQKQFNAARAYIKWVNVFTTVLYYVGPFTNIVSCVILGLVIALVFKISKQVRVGKRSVAPTKQVNTFVIASHITVTLGYSITLFLGQLKAVGGIFQNRINTSIFLFSGLVEIFLSVILWFILDENKASAIIVDETRVYAVIDVINTDLSALSSEDGYNDEEDDSARMNESVRYSGVS
jgi:hypothetical protein